MDVEDIAPGQLFAKTIENTIARCDIALIVIGPKWKEILHARAQQQHRDYVRHEIETALSRQITIIPVLVGGSGIAQLSGLPGSLSELSGYQAAELRDSTFSEDCARMAKSLGLEPAASTDLTGGKIRSKRLWKILPATALVACILIAALIWIGIGPWQEYRSRKTTIDQMIATGRTQANRGEYESAFRTYQNLLKIDPGDSAARNLQLGAAMGWLEDFHVLAPDGAKAEETAGALLAEIMQVLDAGLARTSGSTPRAADILAHIGWAHWLNQRLAHREFGPAAERDLREALRIDASNVYANAMLGNWIIQTGGRTEEALRHFQIAIQANKERPFVRRFQLGALTYPRDRETRVALVRAVTEMRRNGEPIDDLHIRRILGVFNPTVNSAQELSETLSAVPPDDAWATYLWLDKQRADGAGSDDNRIQRDFIHASILEIERGREALAAFKRLRVELKRQGYDGRIASHVERAITRLSGP